MSAEKISRGERNCNPLNLIKGIKWKGLRPEQNDSRFCQFQSMKFSNYFINVLQDYIIVIKKI